MKEAIFEYIDALFADKYNSMYTLQPATIINFDDTEFTLDMKLDNIDLELENIPVSIFGDKNSYVTTPTLHEGTKGLLGFTKHDLYTWLEDGKDFDAKIDYSKNNGFFLLGASWKDNKISNYNLNAVEIKTNKAFECFIEKHILFDSGDAIDLKSAKDTNITSGAKLTATSTSSMNLESKSSMTAKASSNMTFEAPKVAIKNSSTGEELLALVRDSMQVIEDLAHELTLSRDSADNSLLTNSTEFGNLENQIATIKSKLEGFQ